jgi:hypothetical protein
MDRSSRLSMLREVIEEFYKVTSRSNRRPDLSDVTVRKLLASELAGKILKANDSAK